jgi:hypothetical protein
MDGDRVRVLLVGESEAGFSSVKDHLRGFNCFCEFATPWSSRAGSRRMVHLILYGVDMKDLQARAQQFFIRLGVYFGVFRSRMAVGGCRHLSRAYSVSSQAQ